MQQHLGCSKTAIFRIISIIFSIVYAVVWSFISLVRYYAMQANVWDLGYIAYLIHSVVYSNWTISSVLPQLANQSFLFLLAPLALTNSIPAILIFQSVILGIPAYLFFEIALHESRSNLISILISASYILYFPLAGLNWQDVQIMNLFMFLFPLGYLLLLKGHLLAGGFVLILSGTVQFPLMLLVLVSSISLNLPLLHSYIRDRRVRLNRIQITLLKLTLISASLLAVQYVLLISMQPMLILTHSSSNFNPFTDFSAKIYAIILLFAPLLFLPLFSKKWLIPSLVFVGVIFLFNNPIYEYPELFLSWYPVLLIPFLFLGLIDSVSKLAKIDSFKGEIRATVSKLKVSISKISTGGKVPSITITVILLGLAFFLQPYGPLNGSSFNQFNFYEDFKVNKSLFNAAGSVINLIPKNESYILVQNDFPDLFPRTAIKEILVAPYGIGPNVTTSDVDNNSFPYYGDLSDGPVHINYVLTNFNDLHSLTESPLVKGYPTMLQMDQLLFKSSHYGLVAENQGIILMKRNYAGPLKMYVPYDANIIPTQVFVNGSSIENQVIFVNNNSPNLTIRTPFIYAFPGKFGINVTVNINISCNSSILFESGYYTQTHQFIFLDRTLYNLDRASAEKTLSFHTNISINDFLDNAQCFIIPINFKGTIMVQSIEVSQIS